MSWEPHIYTTLYFACVNCGAQAAANPELVMTIDVRPGPEGEPLVEPGKRHPLCEGCARRKVEIHDERGWSVPAMFREESYWRRAYVEPALDEETHMQQTDRTDDAQDGT